MDISLRFSFWFETVLAQSDPDVRVDAIRVLGETLDVALEPYLQLVCQDPDPRVRAMLSSVAAQRSALQDSFAWALRESDFASAFTHGALEWEWEYSLRVCQPYEAPSPVVLVWSRDEDDALARQLALLRFDRCGADHEAFALIVGKRLVNRYTRSARTNREAMLWRRFGRPEYRDPEGPG